ncbi:hypothetical protein L6452_35148 [Arctium lappa]|uniref:Uncharacterized protein n=1 Tax=Arctium lappa TaxID=4217 RepID=A0ACB8YPE1_ARCLA|nr:hypothetical protein L6452_35148 [Arctium lappa]
MLTFLDHWACPSFFLVEHCHVDHGSLGLLDVIEDKMNIMEMWVQFGSRFVQHVAYSPILGFDTISDEQASLQKHRAITYSRKNDLNDEEVTKTVHMPSFPATNVVPINEGRYDENDEDEEGSIPVPSIISKCGSKPARDGGDEENV